MCGSNHTINLGDLLLERRMMSKAFVICDERAPSADGAARLLFVRRSHFCRTAKKGCKKACKKGLQHQRRNVLSSLTQLSPGNDQGKFYGHGYRGLFY